MTAWVVVACVVLVVLFIALYRVTLRVCILLIIITNKNVNLQLLENIYKGFENILGVITPLDLPPNYASQLKDGDTFDYVVVGGGTAGCVVAARLTLSGASVLLVEAGGYPNIVNRIPGLSLALLTSPQDWQYQTLSNNQSCLGSQGRQCRISAGLVLGGGNSIGHMTYIRGNPVHYDNWNIPGWSFNDLLPYFLKYEGLQDKEMLPPSSLPYHNLNGPFNVSFFVPAENPWQKRIYKGFEALQFPSNPDLNAESQIGITQVLGYVDKGERMDVARAYLTIEGVKKKLKLAIGTTAIKVIIDKYNIAKGVTLKIGPRQLNVFAKREVILTAGYIGTPKLMMLSGIGPAEELDALAIDVKADLPVGKELADHSIPLVAIKVDYGFGIDFPNILTILPYIPSTIRWVTSRSGPLASNRLDDIIAMVNSECYDFKRHKLTNKHNYCEIPNFQYIHVYLDRNLLALAKPVAQRSYGLDDRTFQQINEANVHNALILVSPTLIRAKSLGRVQLRSTNPSDPPLITPNYLFEEKDVEWMVEGLKIVEDLVKTEPFDSRNASLLLLEWDDCPTPNRSGDQNDEYWACYARHMTFSGYHGVRTAALQMVVDENLKVYGVERLRVIDSSVLPSCPLGNSGAAVLAVAEKGADIILKSKYKNH